MYTCMYVCIYVMGEIVCGCSHTCVCKYIVLQEHTYVIHVYITMYVIDEHMCACMHC